MVLEKHLLGRHYYITGLKNLDIASYGTGQQISTAGTFFEGQFIANSFSGVIEL